MNAVACSVWLADLSAADRRLEALLDPAERGRLARLRMPADRDRFTIAAALLRSVAGRLLGVHPVEVVVDRTCDRCAEPHGKPIITGSDLHVSLSHSEDVVALAVTTVAPIGVDVEHKAPRDIRGLAHSVIGNSERPADWAALTPDAFYTYWCRKEAVLKATGDGLRTSPLDVVVSPPHAPAALRTYRSARTACAVADLPDPALGPGYAGAVAVLASGDLELIIHRAAGLVPLAA